MTGQAQTHGFSQADFKTAGVHAYLDGGLFDCTNGVYVDVKSYTSFSVDQHHAAGRPTASSTPRT